MIDLDMVKEVQKFQMNRSCFFCGANLLKPGTYPSKKQLEFLKEYNTKVEYFAGKIGDKHICKDCLSDIRKITISTRDILY